MAVLVTTKKEILNLNELVKKLTSRFSNIVSVIQNINSSDTNTILGEEQHVLYGKSTINDILRGLKFAIGAKSFYQVNHDQTEKMYEKVIELGNFNKNDIVFTFLYILQTCMNMEIQGILYHSNSHKTAPFLPNKNKK